MSWTFPQGLQCAAHDNPDVWFDFGCNSKNQLLAFKYSKKRQTAGLAEYVLQTADGNWTLPGLLAQRVFVPEILHFRMSLWERLVEEFEALQIYRVVFRDVLLNGDTCSFMLKCSYGKNQLLTPCIQQFGTDIWVKLSLWVENMLLVPQQDFPIESVRFNVVFDAVKKLKTLETTHDREVRRLLHYCVNCYKTYQKGCSLCSDIVDVI